MESLRSRSASARRSAVGQSGDTGDAPEAQQFSKLIDQGRGGGGNVAPPHGHAQHWRAPGSWGGSSRGASSRTNSARGMRWMEATSAGLGVSSAAAPPQRTTGVMTNPERVVKSSRQPSTAATGRARPTSSSSSRSAVCSGVSPGSSRPPGSAHCPAWRLKVRARRVRSRAGAADGAERAGSPGKSAPTPPQSP